MRPNSRVYHDIRRKESDVIPVIQDSLVLLLIMAAALLGKNTTVAAAVAILLIMQLTPLRRLFPHLSDNAIPIGLVFLMIGVMVPFATGQLGVDDLINTFRTPAGLMAVIGGAVAAKLAASGIQMLEIAPEIIVGIIMGTLVSIIFMQGVPVGPLVAAGVTAVLLGLARAIS